MKIFRSAQIREIDSYTIINEPVESIDLMERAAIAVTLWIKENIQINKKIIVFAGPGNNGGDGLAIARQLIKFDYNTSCFILKASGKLSPDCQINLDRIKELKNAEITEIKSVSDLPLINSDEVIIDALFGTGLTRPLDGLAKDVVKHINNSNAGVISVDMPSGLFGENNSDNNFESVIRANYTLSFQFPKLSFIFPENEDFVGKWIVLPIGLHPGIIEKTETPFCYLENDFIKTRTRQRNKFSHKGAFGHVFLVSGSYGKMGAAVLAAKACLKTGSGLVTVHIPKSGYTIMQTALPEAMVSIDPSDSFFTEFFVNLKYSAIGIGPGIGIKPDTFRAFKKLLNEYRKPMVIDADALNIISENKELLKIIPENSILTPHPKEFERLTETWANDYERLQKQIQFAVNNKLIVVLKGANTSIACPEGTCYFNSTGNPGMATAGSGDVLTGIILSLLGQGYEPKLAAIIGVYIHGLAGDIACEKTGDEALIASDIIENLGNAFLKLKNKV
ncbi:MAG: hypothetical protein A2X13_09085 [Bacteroidetes bacterium GWC2_33_15]|nr:MAG: hypothetical protein A2X10_01715 [Bacteroidetes bacterium GWA2_33_15]OFX49103.1 MAG: hypothetical protein A2X13_09085 [Bacteroidetes bacterium GWC2_33_15]OFX64871.1 MAG: hypothetical protein A2X15_05960 [Bacteroidetes bacterium GWB2_32_14]OFX68579.1 MAG: hypothetical protein A2X14_14525 [Bacteroidetes bacterium GWD2_33_33]HAN17425.1 bifunctional ADP-dependent NAD(P)H-hydrate dehydratase/NAD(P)H-hydrate epimerase [Bacteroidales bacterium]